MFYRDCLEGRYWARLWVGVISGSVGFFLVDDWWGYKARSVEI